MSGSTAKRARRQVPPTGPACLCCDGKGWLPGSPIFRLGDGRLTQAISVDVVVRMCKPCIVAAFVPGAGPHPHPIGTAPQQVAL